MLFLSNIIDARISFGIRRTKIRAKKVEQEAMLRFNENI